MAEHDATPALQYALDQLEKPFKHRGADENGFDPSGLIKAAMARAGVNLRHKAALQQELGYEVGMSNAKPGDLVFFSGGPSAMVNANGLNVGHVAMYLGDGLVIEVADRRSGVTIQPIDQRASQVVSVKRYVAPGRTPPMPVFDPDDDGD